MKREQHFYIPVLDICGSLLDVSRDGGVTDGGELLTQGKEGVPLVLVVMELGLQGLQGQSTNHNCPK